MSINIAATECLNLPLTILMESNLEAAFVQSPY